MGIQARKPHSHEDPFMPAKIFLSGFWWEFLAPPGPLALHGHPAPCLVNEESGLMPGSS